jgi:hypothetical protein
MVDSHISIVSGFVKQFIAGMSEKRETPTTHGKKKCFPKENWYERG